MKTYTIYNAKTHLSQLIEQACAGGEVVIATGEESRREIGSCDFSSAQAAIRRYARQSYGYRGFF